MKMNRFFGLSLSALAAATMLSSVAHAGNFDDFTNAVKDGSGYLKLRYRYEYIDSDSHANDANASTLRTRLGYTTGKWRNFQGTVELLNVSQIFGNEAYNDTLNGKTTYPTVADPQLTELNQAYLDFTGMRDTLVRVGRQLVNLDNQRFVGGVDWRQNDATHDAVAVVNNSVKNLTFFYAYVSNVNTVTGSNLDTDTHLFNVAYSLCKYGKISAYHYALDLDSAALASLDTNTTGIRFDGSYGLSEDTQIKLVAEYARQSDTEDNPTSYDVDYYVIEPGITHNGISAKLGYEVLGSDNGGTVAFQTPLGTNHKFNGWADKFLSTPAAGLEDLYVSLGYNFGKTNLGVTYHDFSSETGSTDYGEEFDVSAKYKYSDTYNVGLYYVNFDADSAGGYSDTEKVYVVLGANF